MVSGRYMRSCGCWLGRAWTEAVAVEKVAMWILPLRVSALGFSVRVSRRPDGPIDPKE